MQTHFYSKGKGSCLGLSQIRPHPESRDFAAVLNKGIAAAIRSHFSRNGIHQHGPSESAKRYLLRDEVYRTIEFSGEELKLEMILCRFCLVLTWVSHYTMLALKANASLDTMGSFCCIYGADRVKACEMLMENVNGPNLKLIIIIIIIY